MNAICKVAPAIVLAGCLLLLGCGDKTMVGNTEPGMSISASATRVFVGDTVTLVPKTRNVLGKDARIDWHSSSGKLSTADDGRLARIVFDTPGTYHVDATLIVDGHEVQRDSVAIDVKPLP
jgi:plastocyanin